MNWTFSLTPPKRSIFSPEALKPSFLKFSSQGGASQQVLRKLSCLPKGQNPAFSQSQSTGLPQETYCPSAVPWTKPVAKTHGSRPGKRGGLSPSAGQLGECRPHPLPRRAGRVVSCQSCSRHSTGNSRESRPLSQDFCNPNYREMIENVPPNQCRHSLQGSYPKALPIGSRQFSKPQKYIKN